MAPILVVRFRVALFCCTRLVFTRREEEESELEVHDLGALLLVEHRVRGHELVLLALHHSHPRRLLVVESPQREGQSRELIVHLVEQITDTRCTLTDKRTRKKEGR